MKTRDFLRMPTGYKFKLTGSHWNYSIEKFLNDDGSFMWLIKDGLSSSHMCVYTRKEPVFEDCYDDELMKDKLWFSVMIGGLSVHSDNYHYALQDLHLAPRSSFKQSFK